MSNFKKNIAQTKKGNIYSKKNTPNAENVLTLCWRFFFELQKLLSNFLLNFPERVPHLSRSEA